MGFFARIVGRPIGASVIAIAVAVLGLLSWQHLGLALLPEVESPIVTVRADKPGASARELEEQLLDPLEELLATLPGLQGMQGRAAPERVEVKLALAADGDLATSIDALRERLAGWRRPQGVGEPRILRHNPGDEPLLRLLLRPLPGGPDQQALALAAREDLLPRLESRPAVASALLRGSREYELRIRPDAERMAAAELTLQQLAEAIRAGVESRSVGDIRTSEGSRNISIRGPVTLPQHLSQVPLPGGLVLRNVAEVRWEIGDSDELTVGLNASGAEDALLIEVLMQSQAAVVAAADDVRAYLQEVAQVQDERRWHFAGGELLLIADRADPIRTALDEVMNAMLVGALLAALVLMVFLRSWWSAAVVFLSVPLSVAGAFLILAQLGVGINLMSLGGLALGIGMLVDNAIVVIESARRQVRPTDSARERQQLVANGSSEVASAVIAATATTLAVFLPLIFAPGLIGDLLHDLAWAVTASLSVSLAIALLVAPPLLALNSEQRAPQQSRLPRVHAGYHFPLDAGPPSLRWWLLSLVPGTALSGLLWQASALMVAMAMAAIWISIALPWLWQQRPVSMGGWRLVLSLPWSLGNLALCWLRWWLVALALLPLWVLRWPARLLIAAGGCLRPCEQLLRLSGQGIAAGYGRTIDSMLQRPWLSVFLVVVIAAAALAAGRNLPLRMLPESTHQRFLMEVQLPQANEVTTSQAWARQLLNALQQREPGLRGVAIAGEDARFSPTLDRRQANEVQLLLIRDQREASAAAERRWLAELERQALAAGALSAAAWPPPLFDLTGNSGQVFAMALAGDDPEMLAQRGREWAAQLTLLGARGVRSSAQQASTEVIIEANARRLQEADLSWSALQERLQQATQLLTVEDFRPRFDGLNPSTTTLPIRLYGTLREAPIGDLAAFDVGDGQQPLPLSSIAEIRRIPGPSTIFHRNGQRVVTLFATALPPAMDTAAVLSALQRSQPLPPSMAVVNYGLEHIGEQQIYALLGLLALAVFLVLVVMAVQFEDLAQPLLVVLAVPMAVAGALPALWLTGHGINTMSVIGLVVLAGISVNNAIVLVTTANLRAQQGRALPAAIAQAGRERLRPIAMTTLTTVLALLPLSIGWGESAELRAPLAIAVIGGMVSSTLLVLLVLPGVMLLTSGKRPSGNTTNNGVRNTASDD